MVKASVNQESTLLAATQLLDLYELDLSNIGQPTQFYFVGCANSNYQNVVFGGQTYIAFPIQIKDFGYDGQGGIVRPKVQVSNINGFVSNLLLQNQDLVGATVTLTRVFARFIDAVNFPGGVSPFTPDPSAAYAPEIFYINRKTVENPQVVEWELATSFELASKKLPSRIMLANFCSWRYREGSTCGYSGAPVADVNGNLFSGPPYNFNSLSSKGLWSSATTYSTQDWVTIYSTNQSLVGVPLVYVCINGNTNSSPLVAGNGNWAQDQCNKVLAGCRARFPYPASLPFGGFPGITRSPNHVAGFTTQYT